MRQAHSKGASMPSQVAVGSQPYCCWLGRACSLAFLLTCKPQPCAPAAAHGLSITNPCKCSCCSPNTAQLKLVPRQSHLLHWQSATCCTALGQHCYESRELRSSLCSGSRPRLSLHPRLGGESSRVADAIRRPPHGWTLLGIE